MKLNEYTIKNVLSCICTGVELYPNDSFASVTVTDILTKREEHLNDYQLFKIGTFDTETMEHEVCKPILIEWDTRHRVENKMSTVDVKKALAEMLDLK